MRRRSERVLLADWQHGDGSEARTDGELAALLPQARSAATAEERAQPAASALLTCRVQRIGKHEAPQ